MRHLFPRLLCICAIASMLSCNKNEVVTPDEEVRYVQFSMNELEPVDIWRTKTSINGSNNIVWMPGDTLGIYPAQGSQVYFVINASGEAELAVFDGGGWAFKYGSTYYGYYPFIGDIYLDRTHIPVSFTGQEQNGTDGVSHVGKCLYTYTNATSAESGALNFSFKHLCTVIRPALTLPAGTYTKLAITAPTAVFTKKGYYNLAAGNCEITGTEYSNQIQIDLKNVTLASETTFYVFIVSAPVDVKGVEITVSVLDNNKLERQCKKTPGAVYAAGKLANITCNTWTEVPQSMGMIVADWGDSGTVSGDAD